MVNALAHTKSRLDLCSMFWKDKIWNLSWGGGGADTNSYPRFTRLNWHFGSTLRLILKSSIFGHTIAQQTRINDSPTINMGFEYWILESKLNYLNDEMACGSLAALASFSELISWCYSTILKLLIDSCWSFWKNCQGTVSRKIVIQTCWQ